MKIEEVYKLLKLSFKSLLDERGIQDKAVNVKAAGLEGANKRTDFPVLNGAEIVMTAEYEGAKGECSTSFPSHFSGTLLQVSELDIENNPHERSIFIAAMNAVMNFYELADHCVSCPESDKEKCARYIADNYKKINEDVKVLLVGYQPFMVKEFIKHFSVRILDLDQDNIGEARFSVVVEHGKDSFPDAVKWADVILCPGSSLSNGTIVDYINLPRDVTYYGATISGFARLAGLNRICPYSTK